MTHWSEECFVQNGTKWQRHPKYIMRDLDCKRYSDSSWEDGYHDMEEYLLNVVPMSYCREEMEKLARATSESEDMSDEHYFITYYSSDRYNKYRPMSMEMGLYIERFLHQLQQYNPIFNNVYWDDQFRYMIFKLSFVVEHYPQFHLFVGVLKAISDNREALDYLPSDLIMNEHSYRQRFVEECANSSIHDYHASYNDICSVLFSQDEVLNTVASTDYGLWDDNGKEMFITPDGDITEEEYHSVDYYYEVYYRPVYAVNDEDDEDIEIIDWEEDPDADEELTTECMRFDTEMNKWVNNRFAYSEEEENESIGCAVFDDTSWDSDEQHYPTASQALVTEQIEPLSKDEWEVLKNQCLNQAQPHHSDR